MRNHKVVVMAAVLTTALLLMLITSGGAIPHGGSFGGGSRMYNTPVPAVSPPPPPWFPHSFPHIWSADDAVNVLKEGSLEIKDPEYMTETGQFGIPAETKELIRFGIPSAGKDIQGCILTFELQDNLRKVRNYYSDLNHKGAPHTWTFLKDNILLVIDGAVPEKKAREYESALTNLKQ